MKPILFKTEMVRALQDDRKTVTRRVVKPKYRDSVFEMFRGDLCESSPYKPPIDNGDGTTTRFVRQFVPCKPPYRPGDILYVREMWGLYHQEPGFYVYKADKHDETEFDGFKWHPSIHMPREAARIFLRVTDVRVERLQDITEDDLVRDFGFCLDAINAVGRDDLAVPFWNSSIKKADRGLYGWFSNPYVWVIEFERCEKPQE